MSKSGTKDGQAAEAVRDYLYKTNRPYSAIDIVNNLHKEHGKTAVQKALDQLVAEGKVCEKTYNKQKVYVANQANFPQVDENEIKALDARIGDMTKTLLDLNQEIKSGEGVLTSLNSSLTNEQAKQQIAELTDETGKLREKIKVLSENRKPISKAEKEQVYAENEKFVKEWSKRKRMTNDMINAILEGYPKTKKILLEEVGVETDEDVGVAIPVKK